MKPRVVSSRQWVRHEFKEHPELDSPVSSSPSQAMDLYSSVPASPPASPPGNRPPPVSPPPDSPPPPTSQSPQSLQAPHRRKKRSPNHVDSNPASSQVISSIISSFEAFAPPPVLDNYENLQLTNGNVEKSKGLLVSPATVPVLAHGLHRDSKGDDGDEVTPAAHPVVRTARSPSGLSPVTRQRSPKGEALRNYIRSARSSTTSLRLEEKVSRHGPDAEGWLTYPSLASKMSVESAKNPKDHKSLAWARSEEPLRPAKNRRQERVNATTVNGSSAQQRPTTNDTTRYTPPQTHQAEKLFPITDSRSGVPLVSKAPGPHQKEAVKESPKKAGKRAVLEEREAVSAPTSPGPSAIPQRSSSLYQTSSPTKKKTKSIKSKLKAMQGVKTLREENTAVKAPRTAFWGDLDEEDKTVKRIKELQLKKELRLREAGMLPEGQAFSSQAPETARASTSSGVPQSRETRGKLLASRVAPEPTKAHKLLGIKNDDTTNAVISNTPAGTKDQNSSIAPQGFVQRSQTFFDETRPSSAETPLPSPDHPNMRAAGWLGDRDSSSSRRNHSSASTAFRVVVDSGPSRSTPASPARSNSQTRKAKNERWAHPDLPLDFDGRRSRRGSANDAHRARMLEESQAPRRDSYEDAVEDYLRAPRLTQKVRHPETGRVIAFSEVGDPNGCVVFVCVGMGLTRYLTAFYDELATTLNLRLITPDRPGVGGSEPYPLHDRSGPLNWADDVLAICEHLDISRFSLLAHSAGAIYALATALILPHYIRGRVHLLAPWIPPSQMSSIFHSSHPDAPSSTALPRTQRILRVLPTPFLRAANSAGLLGVNSASLTPPVKQKSTPSFRNAVPSSPQERRPAPVTRRESIMLMDQVLPSTNPTNSNLPIAAERDADHHHHRHAIRSSSPVLTATATPTDPAYDFASTALNAAEHA
ncbi:hypothetical protein LTR66_015466, partial [Elasticomyces elasticus]